MQLNLKFTSRLRLLLWMIVLGFVMYGAFSIRMMETYRVGGELDQEFGEMGDLRSDIQPSPAYIVESYLLALQIDAAAQEERPPLIAALRLTEQQYLARRTYWQQSQLAPTIKTAMLGELDRQAVLFYQTAFEDLIPALASRDDSARLAALRRMAAQFERHRQAVNTVAAKTIEENQALYARSMEKMQRAKVVQYAALLGFFALLMVYVRQIRSSIVLPLAKAVAIARRVASGDLTEKIVHHTNDETGQLLQALSDMSESLRTRLAERNRSSEARKRALALLEQLIETAHVMVVALDHSGAITIFNAMAEEVSGYARADIIGKKWSEITLLEHPETWQLEPGIAAGHTVPRSVKQQIRCKSGKLRTIDWKNSALDPVIDFSLGMISFGTDITEQLSMEQALRDAKLVAERANRSKSEFLANMSHEIRTPMNAVLGMTALAMRTELSAQQRNYLNKSQRAAKGLLRIIDDILDYSKIEAGCLHFESRRFSVADVLSYISALLAYKAQEKGLVLELLVDDDVPPFLIGDEVRLRQVVLNLLSNAIKFTAEGRVSLRISQENAGQQGTALRFTVDDTGIGIDEKQHATLFDAFEQGDTSTTRHHGGTGLGLTISRSLVQMMHGVIWAERRFPHGSRFVFTAHFDDTAVRGEPETPGQFQSLRTLVVADGAALEAVTDVLNNLRIDVAQVSNSMACLARLKFAKQHGLAFQYVVLDWDMPALDRSALIHRIRSAPDIAGTSIIAMLSRDAQRLLKEPSLDAGIDGVLQHPVDAEQLLRVMSASLDHEEAKAAQNAVSTDRDSIVATIAGARILLVEDNDINQELALEVLKSAGVDVELASNGLQAVAMVASGGYDAVMMDWQMPVMDGLQATRKIRSDARFKHLPIIAMTANDMAGDREKCLAAGMNDHIAKPIDIDELMVTLMRWLPVEKAEFASMAQH